MGAPLTDQQRLFGQISSVTGLGASVAGGVAGILGTGTAIGGAAALGAATAGIGSAVLIIASKLLHGADPNQVPAAKINQIFVGAADKLANAHAQKMITRQQAIDGMDWLIQEFQAFWQQYPQLGNSTNSKITDTVQATISGIKSVQSSAKTQAPDSGSVPVDLNAVKNLYPQDGTAGWYPDAVLTADQVAIHWIGSLGPLSSIDSTVTSVGSEILSLFDGVGQPMNSQQKVSTTSGSNAKLVGWGVVIAIAARLLHFI